MFPQSTSVNIVVTKFRCSSSSTTLTDRQILGNWCEYTETKNTDLIVLLGPKNIKIDALMVCWHSCFLSSWGVNIHVEKKKQPSHYETHTFQLLSITSGNFYCSHISSPEPTFGTSNKTKVKGNPYYNDCVFNIYNTPLKCTSELPFSYI